MYMGIVTGSTTWAYLHVMLSRQLRVRDLKVSQFLSSAVCDALEGTKYYIFKR